MPQVGAKVNVGGGGSGGSQGALTGDVTAASGSGSRATTLVNTPNVQSVILANAAPTLRLIYVDELGADPTGVNDSSAVIRTKQTALGTAAYQLVFGQGTYLMNSAFVNFGPNQGVKGVGSPFTSISWSGSGSLITATATSFVNSARAGAFGGFQIDGPSGSSATTSGISYTNLQSMIVDDVAFYGLPGGAILGLTSSIGGYAEEGQLTRLSMSECGAQSGFVMQFNGVSFDYTKIDAVVVVEANIDVLSITANGQMQGLDLSLRGNCHAGTGAQTGAIVAIERGNASGTGYLTNAHFDVSMEANDLLGSTAGHYLYWNGSHSAASQFSAEGVFYLYNAGAQCQGGVGGNATFNSYNNPAAFSGLTNALDGTDAQAGDALQVMGGSNFTTASVPNLAPQAGAGGAVTLYWQFGDVLGVRLGTGASTFTFAGANSFVRKVDLFLVQPSTGTGATVVWPGSVVWPGGVAPVLSVANNAVDHLRLTYIPATTSWYGEMVTNAPVFSVSTLTVTAGAVTVPVGYPTYNFTVSATTAVSMSTTGAYDGQRVLLRILDGGSAETLTFTNTENSSISVPSSSAGSSTIPRTVDFVYNGGTSKYTCVGWA